jgi:hypothetical protein
VRRGSSIGDQLHHLHTLALVTLLIPMFVKSLLNWAEFKHHYQNGPGRIRTNDPRHVKAVS